MTDRIQVALEQLVSLKGEDVPINEGSRRVAGELLMKSPSIDLDLYVDVDSDGEVNIEWYQKHRHVLSVSCSPQRRLAFAYLAGGDKGYGVVDFTDSFPSQLVDILTLVANKDRAQPTG